MILSALNFGTGGFSIPVVKGCPHFVVSGALSRHVSCASPCAPAAGEVEDSMKKYWLFAIVALSACATLAAQTVTPVRGIAQNFLHEDGVRILDTNSVVYGKTFSEWDAEWQQWAYSIEVAKHPLFDNADCTAGQSGKVWFLGGKFCSNKDPQCGQYKVQRSCTVPRGTYLYFPVDNGEDSALEESVAEHPGDPTYQLIQTMRQGWDPWVAGPATEYLVIDGNVVPHLERFNVQSVVFGFTIPEDNYLKVLYDLPNDFHAGYYAPAVDFGRYIMLAPLPPGKHTIQMGANWGGWGFDVMYFITVPK
jgi:hypothetical protein